MCVRHFYHTPKSDLLGNKLYFLFRCLSSTELVTLLCILLVKYVSYRKIHRRATFFNKAGFCFMIIISKLRLLSCQWSLALFSELVSVVISTQYCTVVLVNILILNIMSVFTFSVT